MAPLGIMRNNITATLGMMGLCWIGRWGCGSHYYFFL